MISTCLKPIFLIAIMFFSNLLIAGQFDNPYQGNVSISSVSEDQLKENALQQVLIKVSGNADIASLPETKTLLKKAQQFISQYGYQTEQNNKYFSVMFDQQKINQSLRDMQQPIWGATRPSTLIWLINGNQLVSEQDLKLATDVALTTSLKKAQQSRGIQVQFPLMDLDDNLAVSVSDVRGRFYDQVANASLRYESRNFIVAEFKALSNNKWSLNWQLVEADPSSQKHRVLKSEQFINTKSLVSEEMINALADYYAAKYAVLENQNEKFTQTIYVDGINSLQKMTQLNSVLENLLTISSFSIVSVAQQQVEVDVKIKGSIENFENTLLAQAKLLPGTAPLANESDSTLDASNADNATLVSETENIQALYFNWR